MAIQPPPEPFVPTWINKVNAIVWYASNPCNAPWVLYFETALPAIGRSIVMLLDFGFDDVVRGALRPRGLRGAGHTRRRGRGGVRGQGVPELGELIGADVPGAQEAKGRSVAQGVKNMWIIDGVIQRGLWYWLVADIIVNFFYMWFSAIQKTQFCEQQGVGSALTLNQGEGFWFAVANAWTTLPIGEVQYAEGGAHSRFASFGNNGKPFMYMLSIDATPWPALPFGFLEVRFIEEGVPGFFNAQATVHENGSQTLVYRSKSSNPFVIAQYRTNGGAFTGGGSAFTLGL